jgi:uncharacterized circularly permuted ATP-grasp superfamily protein
MHRVSGPRVADAAPYDVEPFFDEAYRPDGSPREHYADLLAGLATEDLDGYVSAVGEGVAQRGLEFVGRDGMPSPFAVDPVPRLIAAEEWMQLDAGVGQRTRALHAFLVDVYGEREIVRQGVVPERVVAEAPGYEPDLRGAPEVLARSPMMAGFDVVRGPDGRFEVLEDNLRTPSGSAYAKTVSEVVAEHLGAVGPAHREVATDWGQWLDIALRGSTPDPELSIALLSDGVSNSAWYEHRAIAEAVRLPIVTLRDLEVRGAELFAWIDGAPRRLDAIYRRTDDSALRDDRGRPTALGEALLGPWRAGRLVCINGFGTGVADDKLFHAYVEDAVRFYLGEEPILSSVTTHDLGAHGVLDRALDELDELVVKPRLGHGGWGVVVCAHAQPGRLAELQRDVRRAPGRYVAQDLVRLSRHPTVCARGLEPRHVDLRAFAVGRGDECAVLPGGLTRYAREPGALVVNSSQGGGAKDTWVLA